MHDDHAHRHAGGRVSAGPESPMPRFKAADPVDFVIVGSGSAGGVVARELSTRGFKVVVLEQGPWYTEKNYTHDEMSVFQENFFTNKYDLQPNTYRKTAADKATKQPSIWYGRLVGGGSTHFTANFWRFHPIDFKEKSKIGAIAGTGFADWPISYEDLEPYYTKVEWDIGVSGQAGASPFDPPRSKGYPLPPLPIKSTGVLMERGAKKMGWTAYPAPMAILSKPYKGRSPCVSCGSCLGYMCEVGAKGSTMATMIPEAVKTGNCEVRPESYVRKIETDASGRVTGVIYFDKDKKEVKQLAKAVVVCANGAETPRLLLMSKSNRFPNGLANSSGWVGTHIMFNGGGGGAAQFEHEINGWKGVEVSRVVHDTYELDAGKVGFYGGGGFDFRFQNSPIGFAFGGLPKGSPSWGSEYKKQLAQQFNRSMICFGHTTSLPVPTNTVTLDDTVKDAWGLPAMRMTFREHANDMKCYKWFSEKSVELLNAAGATKSWGFYPEDDGQSGPQPHLLGTCRMGNDPASSVVNKYHKAHDVPNLFLVDGSSFVTGGRGQPTMTIMALAFRAGEEIAKMAKAGALNAKG